MEPIAISPELIDWYQSLDSSARDEFMADVMVEANTILAEGEVIQRFLPYRPDPDDPEGHSPTAAYIEAELGWTPWAHSPSPARGGAKGDDQMKVIAAYELALRQQLERQAYEQGERRLDELKHWRPGQTIKNWISLDAGHNVGKTKVAAGLVSHFFDCFRPSITYCFAPSDEQINDLLFKEIREDRAGKDLPGRVLEGKPRINYRAKHFVRGKATDNAGGTGMERSHGQHGEYLMFVLDEAEGISEFVWQSVRSMTSGGIYIVLVLRNPRTTASEAHHLRSRSNTAAFRISCLDHPNVQEDRDVIPGGVRRDYVESMLEYCEIVQEHDPDYYTFELTWRPGVIYRPGPEFLWRVLGLATERQVINTFCPPGRFDAAVHRDPYEGDDPTKARLGVDVARYGDDSGTLYVRHAGRIRRLNLFSKQDYYDYYLAIKSGAIDLIEQEVTSIHVRIDAGGGFGGGVVSHLENDLEITQRQGPFEKLVDWQVQEINFNAVASDPEAFADLVTEMYYHAAEALRVLKLEDPPLNLRPELCERPYKYAKKSGLDVKVLLSKEDFRKKFKRSPDDGDGLVLATAPDYLFWMEGELVI